MAEFLVFLRTNTHPDPVKNQRGCYKRGDIVVVKPDGWPWGSQETLPDFIRVKIPGLEVDTAEKYIRHEDDLLSLDALGNPKRLTRRRYRVRIDDVPAAIRSRALSTGEVTVTWDQIKGFVRHKLLGVDEV